MISAAITPGTHPHKVKSKVMMNDPKPLSITAKGGNMMANNTLRMLIVLGFYKITVLYEAEVSVIRRGV